MIEEYFKLAFKNLKHRGLRSWLTLLGIFIGVTAVVALISLGNALQVTVSGQFGIEQTELLTIQASSGIQLGPPGQSSVDPLNKDDLEAVKRASSVKRAVGRSIEPVKAEYNDKVIFTYVADIPNEDRDFIYEQINKDPIKGRFLERSDSKKVLLGYNYFEDKVGFDKSLLPGKTIIINDEEFEVVGVLDKKGSFTIDGSIFMNRDDLEKISNIGNDFSLIAAQPISKDYIERAKNEIERELRKSRDVKKGEENFEVSTPKASLDQVNSILGGIKVFVAIIASISILVGALGIVNTMTASVLERKKDIGIMKSVGARNDQIFMQFFVESGLLGLIGGVVGVLFGLFIGFLGTFGLSTSLGIDISPSFDLWLIIITLAGSFLIGGLSGIVPAMSAAKQNPVDALR